MQQFDICGVKGRKKDGLVVVLQHNETSNLSTCIVAPLVRLKDAEKVPKIRPLINMGRDTYILQTDRLAAIARKDIGSVIATARSEQDAIKYAIDRLFIGF
jgi:CcdB protein